MAGEKCWEMREGCECRGIDPQATQCPPYRAGMSCWEFDWLGFYNKLPASEQEIWSYELGGCMECSLFPRFSSDMQTNILMLKESFPHD